MTENSGTTTAAHAVGASDSWARSEYPYDRQALRAELATVPQEPGAAKPEPILAVDHVVRRFGGMTAVDVQHLEVQRGAITALIGPNGAGKTTFFNLITGFDRPSSAKKRFGSEEGAATWRFQGRSMGATSAFRVAQAGMVRTFQLTKALSRMTVMDNMLLGAKDQPGDRILTALVRPLWKKREAEIRVKAEELLVRFKLDAKKDDYAGSLSGGQRKLLEMARALMSDPAMIMLDEPMAGVNPALTQSLLGHIQDLRDQGTTVLFVEHVVRRFGGMTAVDVEHLEVQRGAITALIGPNGAGKTTFFNLITGFDRPSSAKKRFGSEEGSATWRFQGRSMGATSAFRVAQAGMVRTFQLTKALSRLTVMDNMLLCAKDQPGDRILTALVRPLWKKREAEIRVKAEELLVRFKLDAKKDDYAGSLSGGQRKLLEMARALMSDPAMIMLDEPMAGVNPALTQSLLGHIQDLRDQGTTVLFVEHDMHMVRHISDWVVVMAEGRIVAEGPPESVMQHQAVVDAYLGSHHDQDLGDDSLLDEDFDGALQAESAERAKGNG